MDFAVLSPVNVGKTSVDFENDLSFDELMNMEVEESSGSTNSSEEQFLPDLSDESDTESEYDDESGTTYDGDDSREGGFGDEKKSPVNPDEYLFCPNCQCWVEAGCKKHPTKILNGVDSFLDSDGTVVTEIPINALLGPCLVRREVDLEEVSEDDYLWKIDTFTATGRFVTADQSCVDWTTRMSYASDDLEANIYPVQYQGHIYFRVLRQLDVGERLVVYRGDRRGSHYGHPIQKYNQIVQQDEDDDDNARPQRRRHRWYREYEPTIDGGWQCRRCSFHTDGYRRMRYHAKMAHRSPDHKFICKICGKGLASASSLTGHMRTHKDGAAVRRFSCTNCSAAFKFKHHLKRHEFLKHGIGPKPIANGVKDDSSKCTTCGKILADRASLRRHISTIHSDRCRPKMERRPVVEPSACLHCQKILKSNLALKVHMVKAHPDALENTGNKDSVHECEYCFKSFRQKSSLVYHLMRHTGQFPHVCSKCGYGYPTLSELRKHERNAKKCAKVDKNEEKKSKKCENVEKKSKTCANVEKSGEKKSKKRANVEKNEEKKSKQRARKVQQIGGSSKKCAKAQQSTEASQKTGTPAQGLLKGFCISA